VSAADSAVELREVGTGGSLAGKEGTTVRAGVGELCAAGLGAAEGEVEVAGFAVVVVLDVEVVAAAFGVLPGGIHAVRAVEEEKLWCCIRYARGADLEDEAEMRAETPLRAVFDAIVCV
jgi:hypothetical protein